MLPRYLKTSSSLIAVASLAIFLAGTHGVFGQDDSANPEDGEAAVPFALPKSGPFNPADIEIKNDQAISDWFRSAHADAAAEAFRHWDEDEEITAVCATCHSGEGFRDYHGLDGTAAGSVEGPINTGGVVDCGTCHNAGLSEITEVAFPSGLMHPVQGVEASCMTCHQGRSAGSKVVKAVAGLDIDSPNPDLRFINPHYATAAATWLGGYGGSGYHYDGKDYSGRFFHARPVSSCVSCHEPHTLEVAFEPCLTCHQADTPEEIRIARQSYDGSGDTKKGIRSDIQTNAAMLLDMIRSYAAEVASTPIVYDGTRYPYFFTDANGDGVADQSDGRPVAYNAWTPRSLRAAYNWKLVTADPGNYAHNPAYMLELLYDSIEDLSAPLGTDMQTLKLLR
ncbi:cytochrome c3 family protein [Cognatishimia sp. F0-27]|uniref:cytochrome c3 family protein n=1 Tax=Cognatishimia sp. F0-27 TaxID=2816855 RepID=UPI001D0CCE36|nr:cytochrome c3 family protein [Cognatishimia sp. F0-27]MCC1493717.1 cytochrome C [Cognatishimia sp. F0-27]